MRRLKSMEPQNLLKLISLLLQYPDNEILSIIQESDIAQEKIPQLTESLGEFFEYFHQNPLNVLQENYVQTFDFNDKANLYLTFSKSDEDKERGKALAELKEIYSFAGFELESTELPDYLPLVLEFVSVADKRICVDLLSRFRKPITKIRQNLSEINSPYADLLEALELIIDHLTLKEVLS